MVGAFAPGVAEVDAAIDAAFFLVRFDDRVNHVRVGGCAGQSDSAHVVLRWQTRGNFVPCLTAIGGLVNRASGAAINEYPNMAPALIA